MSLRRSKLTAWSGKLEGPEANVVKGFVVQNHTFIGVLDELVNGERRIVGLDDGVGDFRGRENGESEHHPVGVLFPDLRNEKRSHSRTRPTSQRVANLEP